MIDLDKLESLARAATPGPWEVNRHGAVLGGPVQQYTNGEGKNQIAMTTGADWMRLDEVSCNAEFIAAANPAAVLELIALARQADTIHIPVLTSEELVERFPLPSAAVKRIDLSHGAYVERETKTTGEPGWLLCAPDGTAVRDLNAYEAEFIDSTLRAAGAAAQPVQHPAPVAEERAAFDAWWSDFEDAHPDWRWADAYAMRWNVWQARAALAAPVAAPVAGQEPVLWAALNLNGRAVYTHTSYENVKLNAGYIRAPIRVVALVEAAPVPAASVQAATITLDGHQLRMALDLINPDGPGDRDQLDNDLTFGVRQHQDDDGSVSTGMCCWNDDTDGVMPLDGEYEAPDSAQGCMEIGFPDPEAVFAQFCEREGYPSDGETDEALRKAFYEGTKLGHPAPSILPDSGRDAAPADPLQELADLAQELDMGYGSNACPICGKSRTAGLGAGGPPDWEECERIAALPGVFSAMQGFSEDSTGDNGTSVVRAVLVAQNGGAA